MLPTTTKNCENFVQNWPCEQCFSLGVWKYLEERLNIMRSSTKFNKIPSDMLCLLKNKILVYKSFYFQFPAMTIKNMIYWLSELSQVLFWLMRQWSQFSCNVSSVFRVFCFLCFSGTCQSHCNNGHRSYCKKTKLWSVFMSITVYCMLHARTVNYHESVACCWQYERGAATTYISRNQAIRKLQLTLADFR